MTADQPAVSTGDATLDTRVLVIDDDPDARSTLAEALADAGCDVRTAADGVAALVVLAEHAPHCVLLDVQMPGLDGLALARRVRAQHGHDVVMVAITGQSPREERVDATFQLVDHWFTKPVDIPALLKLLRAG
jgi:DNA-binding response OmpR family regulator